MGWTIDGRTVRTPNGNVASFEHDIGDAAEVGGVLIVLLQVPPEHKMPENVFCLSKDAETLWQIERIPVTSNGAYTGILKENADPGLVSIYNWNGWSVTVAVKNGQVRHTQFVK